MALEAGAVIEQIKARLRHALSLIDNAHLPSFSKIPSLSTDSVSFSGWTFLPRASPRREHGLAYLDALRGYAAWTVYNHHIFFADWRPAEDTFLGSLTAFQILFRGHGAVSVFFVISGFVLSYKMVEYMQTNQHARIIDSLSSSIFRRYLRLYLPAAFATFCAMVAFATGLAVKGDPPNIVQDTLLGNFGFWIKDTIRTSDPFAALEGWWYPEIFGSAYLIQMWTIPMEYRGSMILFIFCAGVCRLNMRLRMLAEVLGTVICFWWEAAYIGLFLWGMFLAELRLSRNQDSPSTLRQIPYILLFCLSSILVGENIQSVPLLQWLVGLIMPPYSEGGQEAFPLALGAMLMCFSLDNSPLLQAPLLTPFSQLMGELSFGIYAMHQTVRWTLWERFLIPKTVQIMNSKAPINMIPSYLIMTYLVLWAADLFRRVDVKVVKLTRTLQEKTFEPPIAQT